MLPDLSNSLLALNWKTGSYEKGRLQCPYCLRGRTSIFPPVECASCRGTGIASYGGEIDENPIRPRVLTARRWTQRRARALGVRLAVDGGASTIAFRRVGLLRWQVQWTVKP